MFYRNIYPHFIQRTFKNKLPYHSLVTTFKRKENRDAILSALENTQINSFKDWINVRKAVLEHELNRGRYTTHNIDAVIVAYCTQMKQYDLGASYITFLSQEKIKPNLATIGKYLKLIYQKNHESCLESGNTCSESEEKGIIKYYEDLRKDYPVLDSFSLESVVLALSLTSRWKECLDLLNEIKISCTPSISTYSAVIVSCFLYHEEDLGWKLLEEMLQHEKVPTNVTFIAYIQLIKRLKNKDDAMKKLEKLFLFFQENDLKCSEDVADRVSKLGRKLGFESSFTTVTFRGVCKSCSRKLNSFDLTDEEFSELKNKIFQNVIIGRDLFVKTNPEELERFKRFVENMGRFDVVLDGLNVAYSIGVRQTPRVFSALVASVVSHFVQQRKKVLVLGRVHMKRWPLENWGYVTQNATTFLAQDISQDDPYLLYCALNSGKNTLIVTRDLMRGHKFLLKDARLKMLFNRWLLQKQYQLIRVDDKRGPIFRIPPPFSQIAQCNQRTWHVPYESGTTSDKNQFHRTWLCLKA